MKVISIKEPYASLIKDKKKFIETRSWKTNYRGKLYIHASLAKITKEIENNKELMKLIDSKMSYGYIICKCDLKDCIYMSKEYIENIKKYNYQEYICGHFEIGRYAWILENIETLDKPIKAKGKLGIWTY